MSPVFLYSVWALVGMDWNMEEEWYRMYRKKRNKRAGVLLMTVELEAFLLQGCEQAEDVGKFRR